MVGAAGFEPTAVAKAERREKPPESHNQPPALRLRRAHVERRNHTVASRKPTITTEEHTGSSTADGAPDVEDVLRIVEAADLPDHVKAEVMALVEGVRRERWYGLVVRHEETQQGG